MSKDRQTDPPADHCPICWLEGRDTKLENGACATHRMMFPHADVGPPTRALCQIGECIQYAVACIGGANVCREHRDWKLRKAQPTVGGIPAEEWKRRYDAIMERVNAHEAAEQRADAQVSDAARLRVAHSLLRHRDALMNGGANATSLCHDLQTAATMLAPPVLMPAQPPGLDPATHAHIVEALGTAIDRTADAIRYGSRSVVSEVEGLLVAARAARVALGMQLPPAPPATLYQLAGFLSADIPELHGVEVPRIAESVERFIKTLI